MARPAVLVLSLTNLATDPRVLRQLRLLQGECTVTAAGLGDPLLPGVEFLALPLRAKSWADRFATVARLKLRRFQEHYWHAAASSSVRTALTALRGRSFDVIIANDADTWPLAVALRGRARLLFDAHEYAPREFEDRLYWRILHQPYRTWLCREFLPRADAVTTVCDGIADEYARVFRLARPVVVVNAPPHHPGTPRPTAPDRIRLVHHGLGSPSRRLEVMIDLLRHLDDRFTLDLMLLEPDPAYAAALRRRAATDGRIVFRPPVPTTEIIPATTGYDIGLFLLPPTNFNYRCALPNKFFEFVQARLAVAIGPSPEMARLVHQHELGVVAADFTPATLAAALRPVTAAQVDAWKHGAHRAADVLCWERESAKLRGEINRLLTLGPCAA